MRPRAGRGETAGPRRLRGPGDRYCRPMDNRLRRLDGLYRTGAAIARRQLLKTGPVGKAAGSPFVSRECELDFSIRGRDTE